MNLTGNPQGVQEPAEVCLPSKDGVTLCAHCQLHPATRKFCSNACRQAAHRTGATHRRYLDQQKTQRLARRNQWVGEKIRDKSLTFDGIYGGHDRKIPKLGEFNRYPAETYLRMALEQVLTM